MDEDNISEAQLPLDSVGVRLRRAREEAGLSRANIAASTKIPERHLSAIEEGDFASLPARTYAVGFSRSYARAVGLDEAEIARSVRDELDGVVHEHEFKLTSTFEPGDPALVPDRKLAWLAALGALLVVAAGTVVWHSYYAPAVTLPPLGEETQAAVAQVSAPAPATVTGGAVVFTALEQGVWVKFYDSAGNQLMQKEMTLGESYTVPADASGPQLWTARPQALSITVGGKPVAKLSETQVTMKNVAVTAEALLARGTATAALTTAAPTGASNPVVSAPSRPRAEPRRAVRQSAAAAVPTPEAAPVAESPAPSPAPSTVTQ